MLPESGRSTTPGDSGKPRPERDLRRERVLRYPDLRKALTEPPLSFRRAEDWNGYIPPNSSHDDACPNCRRDPGRGGCRTRHLHNRRVNDSPRRAALVGIAAEALRREQAEQADHG